MSELDENDDRNKCVLSVRLNKSTDAASLTLTGSAFHGAGSVTAKEHSKEQFGPSSRDVQQMAR